MWPRTELNSGRSPNTATKSLTAMMPTFMMPQLPAGCHALWRDEQEDNLQVATRERQTQERQTQHPQTILRAVQYF